MQRTIEGPEKEWLTETEAASWLGVPEPTLAGLVGKGLIPGPRKWNQREKRFHWEAVVVISLLLKLGFLDETKAVQE